MPRPADSSTREPGTGKLNARRCHYLPSDPEGNMAGTQSVRMRILLVGAGGTLGRAVAAELGTRHHIIGAGRSSGDIRLDLADAASIQAGLAQAGHLDAVVCAAGAVAFAPLSAIHP